MNTYVMQQEVKPRWHQGWVRASKRYLLHPGHGFFVWKATKLFFVALMAGDATAMAATLADDLAVITPLAPFVAADDIALIPEGASMGVMSFFFILFRGWRVVRALKEYRYP